MLDSKKETERIVRWLRRRVKQAGVKGLIMGLSGGIDSSVVGVLAKRAFPENVRGLMLPCHSIAQDCADAKRVAQQFSIPYQVVSLDTVFEAFLNLLGESYQKPLPLYLANLIPRLRMGTLYTFAQKTSYLVCGSGNRSEITVGYFTKYGDGGVDLLPIAHLVKSEVRELAGYLGLPEDIIRKAPSAGLWEGQTDEKEMGITYPTLDRFIKTGVCDPASLPVIQRLINGSEHKRKPPPVLRSKDSQL
ncbi:MAG: NAD(+) synthase [Candidatus Atribacteria bacterium]|nr:NAD(+) synthase [Candidatus Atribacteria bacterium]